MNYINYVDMSTKDYLETMPKTERKKIGQFFTPVQVAEYMGGLAATESDEVNILDAGAGSGILSAALLEKLKSKKEIKTVNLDLYENNINILPLLHSNMEYIKGELFEFGITLNFNIIDKNFITENHFAWTGLDISNIKYDIAISNPPYKKIGKADAEAKAMSDIVYGQPNIYFLFMGMASQLLKESGEFIFIIPRSFSSGLYFTEFRKWFIAEMKTTNIHLFISRGGVFHCDNILQETIILKAVKSRTLPEEITITESENADNFNDIISFKVPYRTCVKNDINSFLFIPTTEDDIGILDYINRWEYTLSDAGYRMKTGIVVDFRASKWLRTEQSKDTIPLLWAFNFENNKVEFPKYNCDKPQYLLATEDTERLQMKVENYILIKRFTSKEEHKRLQCALLFKNDFDSYQGISTENHLNFITKINGEMSLEEMYGLFAIINSSYMDRYFRILNGSTQVNANEINSIPFPALSDIIEIGHKAMNYKILNEQLCDELLNKNLQYTVY